MEINLLGCWVGWICGRKNPGIFSLGPTKIFSPQIGEKIEAKTRMPAKAEFAPPFFIVPMH